MREALLHHIWQFKLFSTPTLRTTEGQDIEVLHPGMLNPNAGPDFLEAKLKIGETIWAGNVEIHVKTSDFILHGHETDPNYERLILHVVYENNLDDRLDLNCPTLELKNFVSDQLLSRYSKLVNAKKGLPCGSAFMESRELVRDNWLERMMIERLSHRSAAIQKLSETLNGDLEQVFWVRLAVGFGQKVNADAFEVLARSVPWKVLAKHAGNLHQLEAILFGQAGMFDSPKDEYQAQLKTEYDFLKAKFNLDSMDPSRWKFLRLRPSNFPSIRIAQLAATIHNRFPLIGNFVENSSEHLKGNEVCASTYWDTHHVFGKESKTRKKNFGEMAWRGILINSIVPFAVFLADQRSDFNLKENWVEVLKKLNSESNSVTLKFEDVGYKPNTAFKSQALIQLHGHYCQPRNCVNCAIGSAILKQG
ncbi:MAG: hypothetical protein ACI85F_001435 [Bacteroidia bacterium]